MSLRRLSVVFPYAGSSWRWASNRKNCLLLRNNAAATMLAVVATDRCVQPSTGFASMASAKRFFSSSSSSSSSIPTLRPQPQQTTSPVAKVATMERRREQDEEDDMLIRRFLVSHKSKDQRLQQQVQEEQEDQFEADDDISAKEREAFMKLMEHGPDVDSMDANDPLKPFLQQLQKERAEMDEEVKFLENLPEFKVFEAAYKLRRLSIAQDFWDSGKPLTAENVRIVHQKMIEAHIELRHKFAEKVADYIVELATKGELEDKHMRMLEPHVVDALKAAFGPNVFGKATNTVTPKPKSIATKEAQDALIEQTASTKGIPAVSPTHQVLVGRGSGHQSQ